MNYRKAALLLLLMLCTSACGGNQPGARLDAQGSTMQQRADELLASDPSGDITAPSVPDDILASAAESTPAGPSGAIPYSLSCDHGNSPELCLAFEEGTVLFQLQEQPVHSLTALQQRFSASLATGKDILHSFGYYGGSVTGMIIVPDAEEIQRLQAQNLPVSAHVHITFEPGDRYQLGESTIQEVEPGLKPQDTSHLRPLPQSLTDVEMNQGAPAIADDVLSAVDRVQELYRRRGYPFAEIASTRFILDRASQELEAEVHVKPGDFVRMGDLDLGENPPVARSYFEALRPWRTGLPWSDARADWLRESLQQTGLFQAISIKPGDVQEHEDFPQDELRYVKLSLVSAPERTVGGALKYDTDFGAGVQGFWEHRNLTGHADRLRLEMPIWQDLQELTASYRLPFLFSERQDFIANAALLNEESDAYEITSAAVSAGIERRFSRYWRVSARGSAQIGRLKDPDEPERDFLMLGLPLSATYSNTNHLLNATKGFRITASVAPYTGRYRGDFNALRSRVDGYIYLPVKGEDDLVVALRGSYGAVIGADAPEVPPSVRFYAGGGGSVRGYAYQSIGPRNKHNDPLGGSALVEFSGELRWKVTDTWGAVAFVDGGMAYDGTTPDVDTTLRWGAGLGIRYYTVIGPVRFDVGVPLNKREDDDSFQLYISIGQSF